MVHNSDICTILECVSRYVTHRQLVSPRSAHIATGFAGMVTAVAAWSIWGGDMFPAADPTGGIFTVPPLRFILLDMLREQDRSIDVGRLGVEVMAGAS